MAEVPEIVAKLTDLAKGGDVQAARLLLERVLPPMKATEPTVELPCHEGTLAQKASQVLAAAGTGELAPSQAATIIGALATMAKIAETDDLIARVERLESQAHAGQGKS